MIAAAVIIPPFVSQPVTHGTGLAVEVAGAIAGLLGGLIFMAIAIVLVRTAGLGLRAARLPAPARSSSARRLGLAVQGG